MLKCSQLNRTTRILILHELSVRFRGIRALYGEEGFKKLQNAHVMVIGCGGVGSWITEALCRSGVGTLTLIDPDTVEIGNTNRQLHTTDLTINQYKVRALKNRLITINPEIKIHTLEITLTKENIPEILKDCPQFIADAIDDLQANAFLVDYLYKKNKTFIVSGGAGGRVDPGKLKIDDIANAHGDALISRLRTELRRHYNFPKGGEKMGIFCTYSCEDPIYSDNDDADLPKFGAAMAVTASAGLLMASWLLNKIVKQA